MAFWYNNRPIKFMGIGGSTKLFNATGNARALPDALLSAYADLFEEPRGLPQPRRQDHRTHLLPGSALVVVRPYQYP